MQAPGVGWKTPYLHRTSTSDARLPLAEDLVGAVIGLLGGNRCSEVKRCLRPGATAVLPFCFGRQRVFHVSGDVPRVPLQLRELTAIRFCIVPADHLDWKTLGLQSHHLGPVVAVRAEP